MVSSLFYHKQGFHVARAETPQRERDCASDLGIAKMHQRQKFGGSAHFWSSRPILENSGLQLQVHLKKFEYGEKAIFLL